MFSMVVDGVVDDLVNGLVNGLVDGVVDGLVNAQVADACWQQGPTPYLHLARTMACMEGTTKRLRIADALTNCFRCAFDSVDYLVR